MKVMKFEEIQIKSCVLKYPFIRPSVSQIILCHMFQSYVTYHLSGFANFLNTHLKGES